MRDGERGRESAPREAALTAAARLAEQAVPVSAAVRGEADAAEGEAEVTAAAAMEVRRAAGTGDEEGTATALAGRNTAADGAAAARKAEGQRAAALAAAPQAAAAAAVPAHRPALTSLHLQLQEEAASAVLPSPSVMTCTPCPTPPAWYTPAAPPPSLYRWLYGALTCAYVGWMICPARGGCLAC